MDTENDLTIKTWSCQSLTDYNGSVEAGTDFAKQLMDNAGTNVTYHNMTLFNKSGTYTYYNVSPETYSMIVITSNDLDLVEHMVQNLKQPSISYSSEEMINANITINLTQNNTENDTNNTTTTTTKSTTKKKSSSTTKKSSSGNDGYHYSPQYGDYVKEYIDNKGVQHINMKSGGHESYNPKTNILTYTDKNGRSYDNYVG